jgi:hypothetical protein
VFPACRTALGRLLARRVGFLTSQIRALEKELATLVTRTAPQLLTKVGVGTDTAAALLVAAGDNPERPKTEASFAAAAASPRLKPLQAEPSAIDSAEEATATPTAPFGGSS